MAHAYHHGDLRTAALARVAEIVAADGVDRVSLRGLAADLDVSHTAPRHHFGSRSGLLTAFAAQGFALLGEALRAVRADGGTFLDLGVGYVAFALEHRAHFEVMFDLGAVDTDDPDLVAAKAAALAEMRHGVGTVGGPGARADQAAAALAGWALMHGLATLAIGGNLDASGVREMVAGRDVLDLARRSGSMLYGSTDPGSRS